MILVMNLLLEDLGVNEWDERGSERHLWRLKPTTDIARGALEACGMLLTMREEDGDDGEKRERGGVRF